MNSRQQHIIQALGQVTGTSDASNTLRKQLGIPESVMKAANHNGIWDVTALLPYLKNVNIRG